jgi:hypothetical protein
MTNGRHGSIKSSSRFQDHRENKPRAFADYRLRGRSALDQLPSKTAFATSLGLLYQYGAEVLLRHGMTLLATRDRELSAGIWEST